MEAQDKRRSEQRAKTQLLPRDEGHLLRPPGLCGVPKGSGGICQQPAGAGTNHKGFGHCRWHGGTSPSLVKHALRLEMAALAEELDVEPVEALLRALRLSAGAVAFLQNRIATHEQHLTHDADVDRKTLATWMDLYGTERDRLARTAKMAIDAGIAERQVRMAEQQGALIASAIRAILGDLGLTEDQQALVPATVRKHLLEIGPAAV